MNEIQSSSGVAVSSGHEGYPAVPPYDPGPAYPEYPFSNDYISDEPNAAYEGVRDALRLLGLDAARFGSRDWNPLGEIIQPGQTVVLKPNFVREFRETQPGHGDCTITHGSVIRAVLDYVYIALAGKGRIIVADAPQNDADFDVIRRIAGLGEIQELYAREAGFQVEVYDLRTERAEKRDGVIVGHRPLPGDPDGYVEVNLGKLSAFAEIEHLCHLLYGAEYDTRELRSHHKGGLHEYLVSRTVLSADCVISIPKLKTHKKTGITVSLKNMVGINGNKNWLPHHREGTPAQGGDEFADDRLCHHIERQVVSGFKRAFPWLGPLRRVLAGPAKRLGRSLFGDTNTDAVRSGNWHGNDTTWRMVLDLNRILLYADANGTLHDHPVRTVFSVVDGIIGGEGNGPLDCTPRPAGVVVAGHSPLAVDIVCSSIMGFDSQCLPLLRRGFDAHSLPLGCTSAADVSVVAGDGVSQETTFRTWNAGDGVHFEPHFGWKARIGAGT